MKRFLSLVLLLVLPACKPEWGAHSPTPIYSTTLEEGMRVLFVAPHPKGSDGNTGEAATPLATVAEALRRMEDEGGVIRLAPGVYNERFRVHTRPGSMAPLVIEGARSSNGEWLSVIDGGEILEPRLWKARPDLGPGVYAYPKPKTRFMLVDDRSVARLDAAALKKRTGGQDERPKSVEEVLQWPEDQRVPYRNRTVPFWETLGGVYTPSPAGDEVYLRLRGGSNPASRRVTVAPEGAVVTLQNARNVVLRNLSIRGGQYGVEITGAQSVANRVEQCSIGHGRRRINLVEGARETLLVGNRLEMGFLGHPTGAWGIEDSAPESEEKEEASKRGFIYHYFKYWASPTQISDDVSIYVGPGEGETTIEGNLLDGGLIGIQLVGDARVKGNVIRRMSSVGTAMRLGVRNVLYEGNLFSDCNINLRLHQMNVGKARRIQVLRNMSLLPKGRGTHLFCHYNPETEQTAGHEIAVCQNTFLGGRSGLVLAPAERPEQALRHFQVLNNRFIGCDYLVRAKRPILENRAMFGHFDYNQIAVGKLTPHVPAVWMGAHNIVESSAEGWEWSELHFKAPADDRGRGAGIDLTRPYRLDGQEYPPLRALARDSAAGQAPDIGAPERDFSAILSYAQ